MVPTCPGTPACYKSYGSYLRRYSSLLKSYGSYLCPALHLVTRVMVPTCDQHSSLLQELWFLPVPGAPACYKSYGSYLCPALQLVIRVTVPTCARCSSLLQELRFLPVPGAPARVSPSPADTYVPPPSLLASLQLSSSLLV